MLRNKKTREIFDGGFILIPHTVSIAGNRPKSVAEVNDTWEDYDTKLPLIEDKGIRETIIPWAKVNGATKLKYHVDENSLEDIFRNTISFNHVLDLQDDYLYDITELCGEEE